MHGAMIKKNPVFEKWALRKMFETKKQVILYGKKLYKNRLYAIHSHKIFP